MVMRSFCAVRFIFQSTLYVTPNKFPNHVDRDRHLLPRNSNWDERSLIDSAFVHG